MSECPKCECPLSVDDVTCPRCGALLGEVPEEIEVPRGGKRIGLLLVVIVLVLLAGGVYLLLSRQGPVIEEEVVEWSRLQAGVDEGRAGEVELLSVIALFELNAFDAGEGKRYRWDRWGEEQRKEAFKHLRSQADMGVLKGLARGYAQCVAGHGKEHEGPCVKRAAKFLRDQLRPVLDAVLGWSGEGAGTVTSMAGSDAVIKLLKDLAAKEQGFARGIAGGLIPYLREMDMTLNGLWPKEGKGEIMLSPRQVEQLGFILSLGLDPPAGSERLFPSCRFNEDKFSYPEDCQRDRDLEAAFPVNSGRGRYSYWRLARRVLAQRAAIESAGQTGRAAAYLGKLGQYETVRLYYPAQFESGGYLAAYQEAEKGMEDRKLYLEKMADYLKSRTGGDWCDHTSIAYKGRLPAGAEGDGFKASDGSPIPTEQATRITLVNRMMAGEDTEDLSSIVGNVSVVFLNRARPERSIARTVAVGEMASFTLPAVRHLMLVEMTGAVLRDYTVHGFCSWNDFTLRPGYYLETVESGE